MDSHNRPPKFMDIVKATMRLKRYSPRTEKIFCLLDSLFIRFHVYGTRPVGEDR